MCWSDPEEFSSDPRGWVRGGAGGLTLLLTIVGFITGPVCLDAVPQMLMLSGGRGGTPTYGMGNPCFSQTGNRGIVA